MGTASQEIPHVTSSKLILRGPLEQDVVAHQTKLAIVTGNKLIIAGVHEH